MKKYIHKLILLAILLVFVLSCGEKKDTPKNIKTVTENTEKMPVSLLDNVRLAINPKFQDWVLFENGTYIIFDDVSKIKNIEEESIRLMKEFGPVSAGGPAGDFNVTSLNLTKGWTVSGHGYGMYTYVNPKELETNYPNDMTVGLYGRSKRNEDGLNPVIIHVNIAKK
ncbi:hypothetical protein [Maribacter sp. R77961]|uniref:hypothetical protein n=1 Tax=Maribacter sp. R77961 TaxID=3093871 RepID=UPI0037C8D544